MPLICFTAALLIFGFLFRLFAPAHAQVALARAHWTDKAAAAAVAGVFALAVLL